jgi:hypothetical protein
MRRSANRSRPCARRNSLNVGASTKGRNGAAVLANIAAIGRTKPSQLEILPAETDRQIVVRQHLQSGSPFFM